MGQAQSNGPGSAAFQNDRRINSQPELRLPSSTNKLLSGGSQRAVSNDSTNTNSRRGLIGPMRSRVKGKFPPIASRSQRLIDPFEQPQPHFSRAEQQSNNSPIKDAGIGAYPEWTTTLTSVPTNSPSVRQSTDEQRSLSQEISKRADTLPTRFDTGFAARSAHVDSIFGAGGRQSIDDDQEMLNVTRNGNRKDGNGIANDKRLSPSFRHTPPGSSASPSPNPSPRAEYRVSAQPSHPSITELPETEGADANSILDSRRSSAETIRTASNAATANPGGTEEFDRSGYLQPLRASDDDGIMQHEKRLSDLTTASYDAPSTAPSTASGIARKATDKSNHQTLLAYWQASDFRNQASTSASGHLLPHTFQQSPHRHSWASSRSGARSPGEPRNLSPYRQVAGRWTSHWEDRRGLGISDSSETVDAQLTSNIRDVSPVADNEQSFVKASKPSSELEVNTNIQDAGWQEEKDDVRISPTRPNRKPVPDHEFGPSPATPTRTQARLSEPYSASGTDEDSSKRISDQSHLSSVTGALHQHVERLRAGPTYQIDEDASHLLNPKQRILEMDEAPATPKEHSIAAAISFDPPSSASSSPQQKRGRALSLSLMARLKNRTRKSSDASLLSIRSPSFNRIDPPSPVVSTPQTPISPLVQLRRGSDLAYESTSVAKQLSSDEAQTRQPSSPSRLYQIARRPTRKAAPTTASSDTSVISSSMARSSSQVNVTKFNKDAALVTTKAPALMQRKYSSNTVTIRRSRPASIASRRSSRSKRSSNTSLRTAAASHAISSTGAQDTSSPVAASVSTAVASSGSGPWWNPWSRKNSSAGLLNNTEKNKNEIFEEDQGWIDEPMEDDRGIVSPVAEDFSSMSIAGPEKVQQPWTPAWSNRVTHARKMSETSHSSLDQKVASQNNGNQENNLIAQTPSRESPPLAFIGPNATTTMTASSSFSSLAPPPAPAPVPPPRKHRKGSRKTDSSSQNASSSSTNSPGLHGNEEGTMTKSINKDERSNSLDEDEEFYSPMEQHRDLDLFNKRRDSSQTDTIRGTKVYSAGVVDLSQPGISNTDTRESLLSDDLDYAPTVHDKQEIGSRADDLDNAVTSQFYRSSLIDPRRSRGNNYVNLSPVREIMTPESRIASDDRSGARSVASTFDALSHHRVNSGASMGMIAIPTHATTEHRTGTSTPERRPLPAPSVVAEPRADMSSVHRTNSISSSFATSAAGGQTSVGSMQKHAGDIVMSNAAATAPAAAATAIAQRAASTRATTTSPPTDSRLRAASMPSKPRSPLAQSLTSGIESTSPPPMERHTISPSVAARLSQQSVAATARESWRSSDGPWDGKVVDLSTVIALPAARGGAKPVQSTVRRQRSRSTPFALQDVLNDDIQGQGNMLEEVAPTEAVPFAETAVQASLAALQALEKSEQAQAGDWRARWASEKLLGYSNGSYLSVPLEIRQRSGDQSLQVPNVDDLSDYSGARTRRRAEPYPRSHALDGSASSIDGGRSGSATAAAARRKARSKRQELNSSAGGYKSSIIGGAFTSDSESRPTGNRSRRKKRSKSVSSKVAPRSRSTKLESHPTITASPSQRRRTLTAAEYDEMVVPAHAKRVEREDAEEARMTMEQHQKLGAMPTGMVAAGSPSPITPTFPQQSMSPAKIGDASLMTIIDHDENKHDSSYLGRREATETTNASDKRLPGRSGMDKSITSRRQRSGSGISAGKRHGSGHLVREERERDQDRDRDRESKGHGKQPTNSSSHSIARSTKTSSRKGYGCDDIVAWQASLRMAALPSVSES